MPGLRGFISGIKLHNPLYQPDVERLPSVPPATRPTSTKQDVISLGLACTRSRPNRLHASSNASPSPRRPAMGLTTNQAVAPPSPAVKPSRSLEQLARNAANLERVLDQPPPPMYVAQAGFANDPAAIISSNDDDDPRPSSPPPVYTGIAQCEDVSLPSISSAVGQRGLVLDPTSIRLSATAQLQVSPTFSLIAQSGPEASDHAARLPSSDSGEQHSALIGHELYVDNMAMADSPRRLAESDRSSSFSDHRAAGPSKPRCSHSCCAVKCQKNSAQGGVERDEIDEYISLWASDASPNGSTTSHDHRAPTMIFSDMPQDDNDISSQLRQDHDGTPLSQIDQLPSPVNPLPKHPCQALHTSCSRLDVGAVASEGGKLSKLVGPERSESAQLSVKGKGKRKVPIIKDIDWSQVDEDHVRAICETFDEPPAVWTAPSLCPAGKARTQTHVNATAVARLSRSTMKRSRMSRRSLGTNSERSSVWDWKRRSRTPSCSDCSDSRRRKKAGETRGSSAGNQGAQVSQ